MPNKAAAKKALRQSIKNRARNVAAISGIRKAVKRIGRLVKEKKAADAKEALRGLGKALDKAAQRHVLSRNAAARMKSRIAKAVNALGK